MKKWSVNITETSTREYIVEASTREKAVAQAIQLAEEGEKPNSSWLAEWDVDAQEIGATAEYYPQNDPRWPAFEAWWLETHSDDPQEWVFECWVAATESVR